MVRVSNNLVLNFVTFLLSVPMLRAGIWLFKQDSNDCEIFLDKPLNAIGLFLMLVSLAGLIGACCRVSWLLLVYLLVIFVLIVVLFCFMIFGFVVTNKGAGDVLSGRGYKEYKLGDYSNWLQDRVNDNKNWNKIKSCLINGEVCKSTSDANDSTTVETFDTERLFAIQSGCCKPADVCNFQYVTPTHWTKPANVTTYANADCDAWDNAENTLCFNCSSCKAEVLDDLKRGLNKVPFFNMVFLVFFIIVYTIGCCAFRNNREDNSYKRQYLPGMFI